MKKTEKDIAPSKKNGAADPKGFALICCVFFFAIAVWMFVTGCSNVLKINDLKKNGVEVQMTVTNIRADHSREDTAYYYTFSYEIDGQFYEFIDSPDRDYKVGDTVTTYIDPDHPQNVVLLNANLFFAFFLLLFSGGSLFLASDFWGLRKYIPHALVVWAGAIVATGILLPDTTTCVLGVLFLVVNLSVWISIVRKKKAAV